MLCMPADVLLLACSRDKAYVPGAEPKADMGHLNKELMELVDSLRPKSDERQRQRCTLRSLPFHFRPWSCESWSVSCRLLM